MNERTPIGRRLLRSLELEVERLYPRRLLALGIVNRIPHFTFGRTRTSILRAAGLKVGAGTIVMGPLLVTGEGDWRELFSIGHNALISGPLRVDLGATVEIGNFVRIGHECLLLTVDHDLGAATLRAGPHRVGPIRIGDGAWLSARVTVLPGVTIGAGAVVAAGAVVTRDVAPNTLVAGVPARPLRELDEQGASVR